MSYILDLLVSFLFDLIPDRIQKYILSGFLIVAAICFALFLILGEEALFFLLGILWPFLCFVGIPLVAVLTYLAERIISRIRGYQVPPQEIDTATLNRRKIQ